MVEIRVVVTIVEDKLSSIGVDISSLMSMYKAIFVSFYRGKLVCSSFPLYICRSMSCPTYSISYNKFISIDIDSLICYCEEVKVCL